jgi:RNA polymerase sigma-70 factor, ECF subfamily
MSEFGCLVEREIPRLRRYARALTRNSERADDLVQDTLVRAISKNHLWQFGTDLRAWLFTIMHNQHVNIVRRAACGARGERHRYRPAVDPARCQQ